ncbi:uncharacterized protein LOC143893529 isoform X2 [Temnothorax americanus]|uniref:uncharacterized protein LOC143893529 isoform X2 n=1 Tax=Temnothorax americanus TaxID=1964332 RepID=UPI00406842D3
MKNINEGADLSSSEDETSTNILREAIDQQFLNNDMYSVKKVQVTPSVQTNKLGENSLSLKQEDRFTNFGVTATFQSFIAKKLDEILERTIELESRETINYCAEQKRRRSKRSGIKLLSTSKKLLTITKVTEDCTERRDPKEIEKRSKRNRQIAEDDEDAFSKFREVAIDPECILSKLETKAWVNKRPEPEFKYKRLQNGILIEL